MLFCFEILRSSDRNKESALLLAPSSAGVRLFLISLGEDLPDSSVTASSFGRRCALAFALFGRALRGGCFLDNGAGASRGSASGVVEACSSRSEEHTSELQSH